jgi:hypothetical protein
VTSAPSETTFRLVQERHAELDKIVKALGDSRLEPLGPIHFRLPPEDSAALRFYGSVSWMYIAVWERGGITFRFLIERAQAIGIDPRFELAGFRSAIHALRTLFQHELDPSNRSDAETHSRASRWMAMACNRAEVPDELFWPAHLDEWEMLAARFCESSEAFLVRCAEVVRHVEGDESRDCTIGEWAHRCSRSLPAHVVDKLVADAVQHLGLQFLDCMRVRNTHLSIWNDRLRLLNETADYLQEARRLINETLLLEWQNYCPLSGGDIIEHFSIPPGPVVRELVQRARRLWQASPCSRDELLHRLFLEGVGVQQSKS